MNQPVIRVRKKRKPERENGCANNPDTESRTHSRERGEH